MLMLHKTSWLGIAKTRAGFIKQRKRNNSLFIPLTTDSVCVFVKSMCGYCVLWPNRKTLPEISDTLTLSTISL